MKTKRCYICRKTKPVDEFYRKPGGRHGVGNRCKDCDKAYSKRRNSKECLICGESKSIGQFSLYSTGYRCSYCKDCQAKRTKEWRERQRYPVLTVKVEGCAGCMFRDDCKHLVMERGEDPYCFVSNLYHDLFVQYVEAR